MVTKRVRVVLDTDLLRRIDSDPEARATSRSAFIRSAVRTYLRAKEKREIDAAFVRGYAGKADEMAVEIEPLIEAQAWPAD